MNILIPMAGGSGRFEEVGYAYPKNLIEIDGKPMVEHVVEGIRPLLNRGATLTVLLRQEEDDSFHTADVVRLLAPGATVVTVPVIETGAACVTLLAVEYLEPDAPLLIINGDQMISGELSEVIDDFEQRGLDGGTVVFHAVHPRWSYVRTNKEGLVVEAAEKRPISTMATAGFYWYRRSADYISGVMDMIRKDAHVDGRFYICPAFNEMILGQARIGVHEIDRNAYHSLATPQGVRLYEEYLAVSKPQRAV